MNAKYTWSIQTAEVSVLRQALNQISMQTTLDDLDKETKKGQVTE